jgi:hypothetical protein
VVAGHTIGVTGHQPELLLSGLLVGGLVDDGW